jgi:hypothetical protein
MPERPSMQGYSSGPKRRVPLVAPGFADTSMMSLRDVMKSAQPDKQKLAPILAPAKALREINMSRFWVTLNLLQRQVTHTESQSH